MINLNDNKYKEKPLITKQIIYNTVDPLRLFKLYIHPDINFKKAIISPLRDKEKNPSFGIFPIQGNDILFKDMSLNIVGDIFRLLSILYNISYQEALSKVAIDLNLDKKYKCINLNIKKDDMVVKLKTIENDIKLLSKNASNSNRKLLKRERKWKLKDLKYWQEYGISFNTLKKYNVSPIDYFFIGSNYYKADSLSYVFKEYKDNICAYKIYQPYNVNDYKWRSSQNASTWHGWTQVPEKGEILIITKSLKDVMAIVENTKYSAVALQSESTIPKQKVLKQLCMRFTTVFLLFDNDLDKEVNIGQLHAKNIIKTSSFSNLINIKIPDEYMVKDFSDTIEYYKRGKSIAILEKLVVDNKCPF